ncbi:unnamed protein product [Sphenostylis stenocarpa]|uniref:Uncharacterized protein n=1 Tax=Sphenostylis stenocarpa TaxID=92480 RepID=A0AA86V6S5_9FABA|nr:unnamed protein product [Sphenostylis stenocarpa]
MCKDAHSILQNIVSALVNSNYVGTVSFFAYGDTNRIPLPIQHALFSTAVALNHIPANVKDRDKKILDNPVPANYLIISDYRGLSPRFTNSACEGTTFSSCICPSFSLPLRRRQSRLAGGGPLHVVDSDSAFASFKPTPLPEQLTPNRKRKRD